MTRAHVRVTEILKETSDVQLLQTSAGAGEAILYKALFRPAQVGEELTVNTAAKTLGLGTGGVDFVTSTSGESPTPVDGHILKWRYTPNQHAVEAVEAQESAYHSQFRDSFSLYGAPVLLAELHSMVPIIHTAAREFIEDGLIAFIFDDQASLSLSFSRHLQHLKKQPNVKTVTIGQATGGDFEAVTLVSALQFAKEILGARLLVISVGPGVVGTGTTYGFSGMVSASWANTVGALQGRPVWVPRLSFLEQRSRHFGLSHHTITPLFSFTYALSLLPLPKLSFEERHLLDQQLTYASRGALNRHGVVYMSDGRGEEFLLNVLSHLKTDVQTMGRSVSLDRAFLIGVTEATRFCLRGLS
ncbi:DUF3866 family protein [Shouchella shacheensis]|uniref:DUF3866 family protein n=1 Tax=Shouchella shacheensis TaxID=1649580 RepID=UPI00074044CB|nr:DUF3866 family protein [Shouchella shacheensis]